jgi:2-hydroxychromene-2-carboxylate isomerase
MVVDPGWRVFDPVNPSGYTPRDNPVPAKATYMRKDLEDRACTARLSIVFPPRVSASRPWAAVFCSSPTASCSRSRAVFEAYWGGDAVHARICNRTEADSRYLVDGIGEQRVKDRLRANTDELIRRRRFGSPTMFVDTTCIWGTTVWRSCAMPSSARVGP